MKNKILFIINPVSGVGRQRVVERLIETVLDRGIFEPEIRYTEAARHAVEISRKAAGNVDVVVATGGDGTVNEVAQGLIGTGTKMAVIPAGSGNGFARSLKIPMDLERAVRTINRMKIKTIDTAFINGESFVNVAGVGFDGHISHVFAAYGTRGFYPYVKLSLFEFFRYVPKVYEVTVDGKKSVKEAFSISVANSSQFGNNAFIAPLAEMDDGLLDVCFLKPFALYEAPELGCRLFAKSIHRHRKMETVKGREINISSVDGLTAHIDGEPVKLGDEIKIRVNPGSLQVIGGW